MTAPHAVLDVRSAPDADLDSVVRHLRDDGTVAYPTETVYGLGGVCTERAVDAVRSLKGRDPGKPLLILVPSMEAVPELGWTEDARTLASIFWPGSVTLVLDDPEERFPPGVRSEEGGVAVRVSPHPLVQRLLESLGEPLTSTSLNLAGGAPATDGDEARRLLVEMGADETVLLDGGVLPPSPPSTVVDCTGTRPRVLRDGAVPATRLRCALPELEEKPRV